MKLATLKDGSRDGLLAVVSRDLSTAHYATGIAHRLPGVGQVGAGVARAPLACFENALVAFADDMGHRTAIEPPDRSV